MSSVYSRSVIVLLCATASGVRAEPLYELVDLGASEGAGINSHGDVAGTSFMLTTRAAVWPGDGAPVIDLGLDQSQARRINDRMQIVGNYTDNGVGGIFFWDPVAGLLTVRRPGRSLWAWDLNKRGQFVGYSVVYGSGQQLPVLFDQNTTVILDPIGGPLSNGAALAIDARGTKIVGWSDDQFVTAKATLWTSAGPANLGTLGGAASFATDINSRGQIVGASEIASGDQHAFVYEQRVMVDLGVLPGTVHSTSRAINNQGMIVGEATTQSSTLAFLYEAGHMYDLNTRVVNLGDWALLSAMDINDRGQITGYGRLNGESRAYRLDRISLRLLDPVPGIAGQDNQFKVVQATPGERGVLVIGLDPGVTQVGRGCVGLTIELMPPVETYTTTVKGNGVATFDVYIPRHLSGQRLLYQYLELDRCEKSELAKFRFP